MVGKLRHGRYALPFILGAVVACGPRPLPDTMPPSPQLTSQPERLTTPAKAPAPHLQLTVRAMAERTGGEFGLAVPMLLVALRNDGAVPAAVPPPGLDMLLSLQVVLKTATTTEQRRVTLGKPWTIAVQPLAPEATLNQSLSPLSREQRDVPLTPGRYQVSVCVIPDHEATYRSEFTAQLGGICSNEIELVVRRGK